MGKNLFTKKILPMALATAVALSPVHVVMAASSDIAGHWAEKTITEWQDKGLISGYNDGTFKPNNNITRAEFVTIMNNALGFSAMGDVSFTDVKAGDWFYNAVAKAAEAGYTKGYEDGSFQPNKTISRAEAAVMIANAADLGVNAAGAAGFADFAAIPGWAQGSIGAAAEAGFMTGRPDGTFDATASITRAEAVSSLNRVMGGMVVEEVEKDVTLAQDDAKLEDTVVAGDLIIDEAIGDGEVYLDNVEVEGDLIVNGGGDDSIYMKNVKVHGKTHVNKHGVRLHMQGKTDLPQIELNAPANLSSDDTFEGEIGTVTITKDLGTTRVQINVTITKLVIDGKASVAVNADIKTIEITEDAEGARVEVAKDATVGTVVADAAATLAGQGTIETLEVNADGVVVNKNLEIEEVEVADDVDDPVTTTNTEETTTSGGGGGSSSSSSSKKEAVTASVEDMEVLVDTDGFGWDQKPLNLNGAAFKVLSNMTYEEFWNLDDELRKNEVTLADDSLFIFPFIPFDWTSDVTELAWEGTTDVEFEVYVSAEATSQEIEGDYTYELTIPADMLSKLIVADKGYKVADLTVKGNVTVVNNVPENPTAAEFTVTIGTMENGTVTADKTTAAEGETVTLTVKPDAGYVLESLIVADEKTYREDLAASTAYVFEMPASNVTVYATFVEDTAGEVDPDPIEKLTIKLSAAPEYKETSAGDATTTWTEYTIDFNGIDASADAEGVNVVYTADSVTTSAPTFDVTFTADFAQAVGTFADTVIATIVDAFDATIATVTVIIENAVATINATFNVADFKK